MKEQLMGKAEDSIVNCTIENSIATIVMDDGKNNLISPNMLYQLNRALDKAEKANAVVVITGKDDIFCAGFDLNILKTGVISTFKMLIGGFSLSKRLLAFPTPVIISCNGHAIAMGSFLLLSGDYRIGAEGDFKIVANEVEIGLTVPYSAIEICRQRLRSAHFDKAVLLSQLYTPQTAVDAGFLDEVVPKQELQKATYQKAEQFAFLDLKAHQRSKLRMRRKMLKNLTRAIRYDKIDFFLTGIKRVLTQSSSG
jgi:enoyl-CoA hydratase